MQPNSNNRLQTIGSDYDYIRFQFSILCKTDQYTGINIEFLHSTSLPNKKVIWITKAKFCIKLFLTISGKRVLILKSPIFQGLISWLRSFPNTAFESDDQNFGIFDKQLRYSNKNHFLVLIYDSSKQLNLARGEGQCEPPLYRIWLNIKSKSNYQYQTIGSDID